MATYLFTWNPERWNGYYLEKNIAEVKRKGYCNEGWSCGVTKSIVPSDRAFLIKVGPEPRGIVGSGWVVSDVYRDVHWDKKARSEGKTALYVDIHFDTILDSSKDIFHREWLETGIYRRMHWAAQASGIRIPDDVACQLEQDWAKFLNRPHSVRQVPLAEEVDSGRTFPEGTTRQITVNIYERSAEARTICINHYGISCAVCGFNFEKVYGPLASDFIHVHHLKPLAELSKGRQLNPLKDIQPVCPNCHAVLHLRKPAYSIEELKAAIKSKR